MRREFFHSKTIKKSQPVKPAPLGVFIAATIVFFFVALSASDSIGFVPCQIDGTCESPSATSITFSNSSYLPATIAEVPGVLPTHITIAAIGLDLPVQNTSATDFETLDIFLQKGPVRYALTGKLGESTNMVIFGHSSHLPIVRNQMYKAFNRVPELKAGDTITLTGEDGATYLYTVVSVENEDARNFTENFVEHQDKQLIIVTCDTLSGKSARFIVRADFVGVIGR